MGQPKAWLPVAGEPMLARVVRLLSTVVQPIVVVAAPGQDVPPLPAKVLIVRDEEQGRGPLQGLAAGLAALEGRADAAFVSSCDVPLLEPAFVAHLIEMLGDAHICVPRAGEYPQPLAAVYRLAVLPSVRRLLGEDRRGVVALLEIEPTRVVDVEPGRRSLWNVNTPEDYARALREL